MAGVEPRGRSRGRRALPAGRRADEPRRWRDGAIDTFSAIITKKPDFAEGWNKRATVYYLIGEYEKSLADCDEVVKRNPYHFGALSGYGQIYMQLDQPERALDYFERALDVNPNLRQVEVASSELRADHRREAQGHDLASSTHPEAHRRMHHVTHTQQVDALKKITSPSVANAIETFKVRPREQGNLSSDIKALFPEMGPMVGYAVTAIIRAEPARSRATARARYGWWDYVLTIPAPRVIVVHDLDEPRGQGAQWGEVQANIHRALGCVGVVTDGSVRDLDEVRALGFQFAPRTCPCRTPTSTWWTSAFRSRSAACGSSPATSSTPTSTAW